MGCCILDPASHCSGDVPVRVKLEMTDVDAGNVAKVGEAMALLQGDRGCVESLGRTAPETSPKIRTRLTTVQELTERRNPGASKVAGKAPIERLALSVVGRQEERRMLIQGERW